MVKSKNPKPKENFLFWKFPWKIWSISYKTALPLAFSLLLIFIFRKFIMLGKKVRNNIIALQMEKMRSEKRQLHMLLRTKERKICHSSKKRQLQGKLTIETVRCNREEKFRSRWQKDVVVLVWLLWPIPLSRQNCSAGTSATFCAGSLRCQQIYYLLAKWPHFVYSRKSTHCSGRNTSRTVQRKSYIIYACLNK